MYKHEDLIAVDLILIMTFCFQTTLLHSTVYNSIQLINKKEN